MAALRDLTYDQFVEFQFGGRAAHPDLAAYARAARSGCIQ